MNAEKLGSDVSIAKPVWEEILVCSVDGECLRWNGVVVVLIVAIEFLDIYTGVQADSGRQWLQLEARRQV